MAILHPREAEFVGNEFANILIKFKNYSPPKKIAFLLCILFFCSLPYYLIFNLNMNPAQRRLRSI